MKTDPARENPFTLAWWGKRPTSVVLPGFLILSLLVHAATFIFFQIVYPEKVVIPQTAPQVSRLTPSSPENIALLRWIESEDPAIAAASPRAEPQALAQLEYQPFFATSHTPARYVAPTTEKTPFPGGRDPLEIIASVSPPPPKSDAAPARLRTQTTLSGEIAGRTFTRPPEFKACTSAPLEAAQFLIGVTGQGEIRYSFLQRSSGDPHADDSAAAHLAEAVLDPAEAAITWGFATIEWGDDAYFPPSPGPKSPVPPPPQAP